MKMFLKFVTAILFLGGSAFGQEFKPVADESKVFNLLRKSSETTTTIQADFKEERYVGYLAEPSRSSGKFYYKKSDKMRWEQETPLQYVILINGSVLRIKEGGKEKNVSSAKRMTGKIRDLFLSLVSGDFQNSASFTRECQQNADSYLIILTPVDKRLKNVYSKINLVFSKKTLVLKELTFQERSGDKSLMKFFNEKVNGAIGENVFVDL